jgi:hypothetical protein
MLFRIDPCQLEAATKGAQGLVERPEPLWDLAAAFPGRLRFTEPVR